MRTIEVAGVCLCMAAACAFADFGYEQTSKITGGMAAGAMKVAGVFSKKAREPVRTAVLVKGDRMAHVSADLIQVIDLGGETITDIELQKKTYSLITFAEAARAMEKVLGSSDERAEVKFKASVKDTGQRRAIGGLETRQVILTLEMESKDRQEGVPGTITVTSEMWLASDVPGYDEVRRFYQRMGQKIGWTPGSSAMGLGDPGMSRALADLQKEAAKLEGVPVLQVIRMGGAPAGEPQTRRDAERTEEKASPSITGALGRLGGLGGLSRRKKPEPETRESAPPGTQEAAPAALMEVVTESVGFSTAPIDASRFEVPAGFKKVESDLTKR